MADPQVQRSPDAGRSRRGFASMDREKQREIASRGGRAAHAKGTAHEFDSGEASLAAKSGHRRGTAHEFTVDEARQAGRKGGMARAANRHLARRPDGQAPPNPPAESGISEGTPGLATTAAHQNPPGTTREPALPSDDQRMPAPAHNPA